MLRLTTFTLNGFGENTYLIHDTLNKEAVLIDPGYDTALERKALLDSIAKEELLIKAIWLTHSHIDHILGLTDAISRFKVPYFQHKNDVENLSAGERVAHLYGLNYTAPGVAGILVEDNASLEVGNHTFKALLTEGHAQGHLAYYNRDVGVIAGDALFEGSIGRTDLPGGDLTTLTRSIKERLYTLAEETVVYPGHGGTTTIGKEKRSNPFVRS
jgi:hydroxyacylglutathione hydrolase